MPGAGYSAQCRSAAVGVPRSAGHWEYPIYREIHEVDFGCTLYIHRIQGKNILRTQNFRVMSSIGFGYWTIRKLSKLLTSHAENFSPWTTTTKEEGCLLPHQSPYLVGSPQHGLHKHWSSNEHTLNTTLSHGKPGLTKWMVFEKSEIFEPLGAIILKMLTLWVFELS